MKKYIKILPAVAAMAYTLSGCVEEVDSYAYVSKEQVESLASSQEAMLNGLAAFLVDNNTWGQTYYYNDYGYPAQMFFRNILGDDFPISEGAGLNYWMSYEQSTELRWAPYYTYNYYYHFAKNCNNLISAINPETASSESLNYLGCAIAYRALCYFDMARLFEYKTTGYSTFDDVATKNGVMGLTVPIVTEDMTEADMRNNPRAPFYTMYRFILSDLDKAEKYLEGYSRPSGNYPNQNFIYGMKARFWLELATRFSDSADDLATQLSHESDDDGYTALGITTANECYQKALEYAQKAEQNLSPMTQAEWTNSTTGFNTATNGWIFYCSVSTTEQEGQFWESFIGTICTEAEWGLPQYSTAYREISSYLYDKIDDNDWRKLSWIDPDDAGKTPDSKYKVVTSDNLFKTLPAYTNLKFRTRDISSLTEGMKCDMPIMRVEEMYFIEAEATAHLSGYAAGYAKLKSFLDTYRYSGGTYSANVKDMTSFENELINQKKIEFWGEGLTLFDMKRLNIAIKRSRSTNYTSAYVLDSKDGYVCPSMNYYIMDYAPNQNSAVIMNPDCSGWNTAE